MRRGAEGSVAGRRTRPPPPHPPPIPRQKIKGDRSKEKQQITLCIPILFNTLKKDVKSLEQKYINCSQQSTTEIILNDAYFFQ